ncbi:membrane-associated protein, putative [Bodo saltans]|uniref:Membrane-associated protein, putative n=1 Tax=Bodo saltans TaxID=75058 RepID=A0A0S4IP64_BODSA|nr:membrane-associated protein, putative [Bodo saltans]|eukprot:CUF80648.1 membrane-associated protein, putative [Bodo saltans]
MLSNQHRSIVATWSLPIVVLLLLLVVALVPHPASSSQITNGSDDVVEAFNRWYLSDEHHHRAVRVRAKRLSDVTGDNGIGLVAATELGQGDVYLDVNTSLVMSARAWLADGGRSLALSRHHQVTSQTKNLFLRHALQLATLRWILASHTDIKTDVQELMMGSAEGLKDWSKRNETAGRVLLALNTDERDIVLAMYLMFEYFVMGVKDSFFGPYLAILPEPTAITKQSAKKGKMYDGATATDDLVNHPTRGGLTSVLFDTSDPEKVAALEGTAVYLKISEYRTKMIMLHQHHVNKTIMSSTVLRDSIRLAVGSAEDKANRTRRDHGGDGATEETAAPLPSVSTIEFPNSLLAVSSFKWALGVLWSRQVWWDGEAHLAPMHDLANCREQRGVVAADGRSDGLVVAHRTSRSALIPRALVPPDCGDDDDECEQKDADPAMADVFVATRATDTFLEGDEVFENYGETNSFYLLFHGFVLNDNSKDCAMLTLPEALSTSQNQQRSRTSPTNRAATSEFERYLSAPVRRQLKELGGFLRDPLCPSSTTTNRTMHLTSLEVILTTIRAGYLVSNSARGAYPFLNANGMMKLRQLSRFDLSSPSAMTTAVSTVDDKQRCMALTSRHSTPAIRPDYAQDLCSLVASREVRLGSIAVAKKLVDDQLHAIRPQYEVMWSSSMTSPQPTEFLSEKLQLEDSDRQRGMFVGTSWRAISRFVSQQYSMLTDAKKTLAEYETLCSASQGSGFEQDL